MDHRNRSVVGDQRHRVGSGRFEVLSAFGVLSATLVWSSWFRRELVGCRRAQLGDGDQPAGGIWYRRSRMVVEEAVVQSLYIGVDCGVC